MRGASRVLVLPSDRVAAKLPSERPAVPALLERIEMPDTVPSVHESLTRQMDVDRSKVSRPPAEYTGLAGVGGEIDAMLAHLER